MDELSACVSLCSVSNVEPEVKTAAEVMGCEAQKYANESVGGTAKNEYVWVHRMSPALTLGADEPTNLVCGTVEADSFLHIYRLIARICLQNRNDDSFPVAVTSECNWGVKSESNSPAKVVKSEPNAPAKLNHSVNFNSNLMGAVIGLDLRLPLAPSQWINAVVSEGEGEGGRLKWSGGWP